MDIRNDIKTFLETTGWTQAKLSRAANIHPIIISRLLRGERKGLNTTTLEKLWPVIYDNNFNPNKEA